METIFRSIAGIGKQIRAIGMVSYYMKLIIQLLNFYLTYYWNHMAITFFNYEGPDEALYYNALSIDRANSAHVY